MIVDVVRATSFSEIERVRKLPIPGQVLVEMGMEVNPQDVIAEAQVPGKLIMLDIAKSLGISPDEMTSCLIREVGDVLEEGDIIAQHEKALPRIFRAPINGKIINYYQGQMVISTGTIKTELTANLIGTVKEIIPEYGVVLSLRGSVIQGFWGNGLAGSGILKMLDASREKPISTSVLKDLSADLIIAGGACVDGDVLDACLECEISGLILGSLSQELIQKAAGLPFPVILLHGFGEDALAQDVFEILQSHSGEKISLNACKLDHANCERPELVIHHDEEKDAKELGFRKKLEPGDRVRLMSGKAKNQVGKVVELIEEDQFFENGTFLPAALIKLPSLEKVKVPQSNLVIVG
ncbi:MAG: hypothetical protein SCH68_08315 [Brevefilum sp.]|nr:hypothetical protein [Brevefilum sp.]